MNYINPLPLSHEARYHMMKRREAALAQDAILDRLRGYSPIKYPKYQYREPVIDPYTTIAMRLRSDRNEAKSKARFNNAGKDYAT